MTNCTVIIPTYRRPAILETTLEHLATCRSDGGFEVIVCDDGSADDTPAVVDAFSHRLQIRYLHQEDRGFRAGAARNLGIRHAAGRVLIFIDDDMLVRPDFIEAHARLHGEGARVVIGRRLNVHAASLRPDLRIPAGDYEEDQREKVFRAGLGRDPAPWRYLYSCNFSIPADSMLEFDEGLEGYSMEDIELGYRLWKKGVEFIEAASCTGFHVMDGEPRNPFDRRRRGLSADFDIHLRNTAMVIEKHQRDKPVVRHLLQDHLGWFSRDPGDERWIAGGGSNPYKVFEDIKAQWPEIFAPAQAAPADRVGEPERDGQDLILTGHNVSGENASHRFTVNAEGEHGVQVEVVFEQWAFVAIGLVDALPLASSGSASLGFEVRIDGSGDTPLFSLAADGDTVVGPRGVRLTEGQWHPLQWRLDDAQRFASSSLALKILFNRSCRFRIRNARLYGMPWLYRDVHLVVPWFGRNHERQAALLHSRQRLLEQSCPFEYHLVELITEESGSMFDIKAPDFRHWPVYKDARYLPLFQKEALFNHFIRRAPIRDQAIYVFIDADVHAEDPDWLESLVRFANAHPMAAFQGFDRIEDEASGKLDYSWCKVQQTGFATNAVNPGLCWVMTGRAINECAIRFPHRLVTGVGDLAFVTARLRGQGARLPAIQPFVKAYSDDGPRLAHACFDATLTHTSAGGTDPRQYALRDLLWQICLDNIPGLYRERLAEDDDGFLHLRQYDPALLRCLVDVFSVASMTEVVNVCLREFGARFSAYEHLLIDSPAYRHSDHRLLTDEESVEWLGFQSMQRFYAQGVRLNAPSRWRLKRDPWCSEYHPLFRPAVDQCASRTWVMLTRAGLVAEPSILTVIDARLGHSDFLFVKSPLLPLPGAAALESHGGPSPGAQAGTRLSMFVFNRKWWQENARRLPQGLVWSDSLLDCVHACLEAHYGELEVIEAGELVVAGVGAGSAGEDHNERMVNAFLPLIHKGCVAMGSKDPARRKFRIDPEYYWPHHYGNSRMQLGVMQRLASDSGVLFNPAIEADFLYLRSDRAAYREPWTGILHHVFDYPDFEPLAAHSLDRFLGDERLRESLESCVGVYVFSHYLARRIRESGLWPERLAVEVLPFAGVSPGTGFQTHRFRHHEKTIYSIGWYCKRLHAFLDLELAGFSRTMLCPQGLPVFDDYLAYEKSKASGTPDCRYLAQVSNAQYDEILSRSLVYLDYYDLSASNVLVECLLRHTPMLVRWHPAAEEHLGRDYPLFFDGTTDMSAWLHEERIMDAYNHLARIDKRCYEAESFYRALTDSEIYKSL